MSAPEAPKFSQPTIRGASMFFEAASVGVPFPNDPAQGYAWHLMAARAGHFNSQFDLGTGRVPGTDPDAAKRLGTFWLRRAAEQHHPFQAQA